MAPGGLRSLSSFPSILMYGPGRNTGPPGTCSRLQGGLGGEKFRVRGPTNPSGISLLQFPIISCNEVENRINNASNTV